MATQVSVNSSTGNITVAISRTAFANIAYANNANYANFANTAFHIQATSPGNIGISGGTDGQFLQTDGAAGLTWATPAGGGGGSGTPGGANTQVQFNNAGAFGGDVGFTYDNTTDLLTAAHFSGEAANLNSLTGANVTGEVAFAATANGVSLANVVGAGNIASINLDGVGSNVLYGNGIFGPLGAGAVANFANFAGNVTDSAQPNITSVGTLTGLSVTSTISGSIDGSAASANAVAGANVSGSVPVADLATFATTANAVAGANVSGAVDFATTANAVAGANVSGEVSFAATANAVAGANVSGSVPIADLATFATTANAVAGANVSGEVSFAATANAVAGANVSGSVPVADLATFATTANAVAGANVSGEVSFAATANAVALANVSGAGNIASINLDGNVANYIDGTGAWGPISTGSTSSISNGTSNVDIAVANGNVTIGVGGVPNIAQISSGGMELKDGLYVNGVKGNILIQPNVAFNGSTYGAVIRGEYDTGTGNSTTDLAFITDNYTTQGVTTFKSFANTASGNLAAGASLHFNNNGAIGNSATDPLVPSVVQFVAIPGGANLANVSTQTVTTMTMGNPGADGFLIVQGTNAGDSYSSEVWKQFQYRPKAMGFIRRNGNADSRTASVADDETSFNFYNTQQSSGPGSSSLWNYPAKMGAKVDPTWVDPQNGSLGVPQGVSFVCVDESFANLEHRMFGNGDVSFNYAGGGTPVTISKSGVIAGVITGDGSGLTSLPIGGSTDSVQYNTGSGVGGDSVFTYEAGSKQLGLTGAAAGVGGVPSFTLTNGAFTVSQEEIGGGVATFNYQNFYAGSLIAPSTYFRARGTANSPTTVAVGDQVVSDNYYVNAGGAFTYKNLGGVTATVGAYNVDGNVAMTYDITTAGADAYLNDKVSLTSSLVEMSGNVTMTGVADKRMSVNRFAQQTDTFANLPSVSVVTGERAFVTDMLGSYTFGGTITDGGTNVVPVFWDGTQWRMG